MSKSKIKVLPLWVYLVYAIVFLTLASYGCKSKAVEPQLDIFRADISWTSTIKNSPMTLMYVSFEANKCLANNNNDAAKCGTGLSSKVINQVSLSGTDKFQVGYTNLKPGQVTLKFAGSSTSTLSVTIYKNGIQVAQKLNFKDSFISTF